ncbi:uncharacterized protein [Dermacentor albipictus]|uniref:uncharacterized protein n=1 Tax=Dermacentor albipictus TaxID=60249 RepID=UPI0031FDB90E
MQWIVDERGDATAGQITQTTYLHWRPRIYAHYVSSSTYFPERSSRHWDTSGHTASDLSTSEGRLFVVATREPDTPRLDLTCWSFALAFLVVMVVAMVLFAARHRRRLLDEEVLLADSADRDGLQGEAALREASDRKRKGAVFATHSSGTSRRPKTEVAVAGRHARGGVPVNFYKSTPRKTTLSPSGNRRPARKSIGEAHDDELAWKKNTAKKADVDRKNNRTRPRKPMTTAAQTSPAVIFTLKRTPHRRPFINFAVTTAKTAGVTSTSAASFTTTKPPSTAPSRFPLKTRVIWRPRPTTGIVNSFGANSPSPAAPFAGGVFRDFTKYSLVPTMQRTLTPTAERGFPESTTSSFIKTKQDGVMKYSVITVPLATVFDLPKSFLLDKTSRGAASGSSSHTAKASTLETDESVAHTEPFADDSLNYFA